MQQYPIKGGANYGCLGFQPSWCQKLVGVMRTSNDLPPS